MCVRERRVCVPFHRRVLPSGCSSTRERKGNTTHSQTPTSHTRVAFREQRRFSSTLQQHLVPGTSGKVTHGSILYGHHRDSNYFSRRFCEFDLYFHHMIPDGCRIAGWLHHWPCTYTQARRAKYGTSHRQVLCRNNMPTGRALFYCCTAVKKEKSEVESINCCARAGARLSQPNSFLETKTK